MMGHDELQGAPVPWHFWPLIHILRERRNRHRVDFPTPSAGHKGDRSRSSLTVQKPRRRVWLVNPGEQTRVHLCPMPTADHLRLGHAGTHVGSVLDSGVCCIESRLCHRKNKNKLRPVPRKARMNHVEVHDPECMPPMFKGLASHKRGAVGGTVRVRLGLNSGVHAQSVNDDV